MTNTCRRCGHEWFDNALTAACPKCGSTRVERDYDEEDDEMRPLRDLLRDEAKAVLQCAIAALDDMTMARCLVILDTLDEASDLTLMRSVGFLRQETRRAAMGCDVRGEA